MKITVILIAALFIVSCAGGKEKSYTGSTPAGITVRSFLGIPLTDSIDFIRWKLTLRDDQYHLQCNYGIGKPNTNGFINGGKTIELNSVYKKEKNYYQFQNGDKSLKMSALNNDLLHLMDENNNLLVGNGGWSYTINSIAPSVTDQVNFRAKPTILKDSIAFEGRTPCNVPGVIPAGQQCYKLKWYIVLYANAQKNETGTYKVLGTAWRREGGKLGNWKIITGKDGRIIYQLNDDKGKVLANLLKADDNILLFTDTNGKLLTGNEDFSYTLNRSVKFL